MIVFRQTEWLGKNVSDYQLIMGSSSMTWLYINSWLKANNLDSKTRWTLTHTNTYRHHKTHTHFSYILSQVSRFRSHSIKLDLLPVILPLSAAKLTAIGFLPSRQNSSPPPRVFVDLAGRMICVCVCVWVKGWGGVCLQTIARVGT